jgi:hypothetical protein
MTDHESYVRTATHSGSGPPTPLAGSPPSAVGHRSEPRGHARARQPDRGPLLDLLDGSRTEVGLVREAIRQGIPARDAVALLAALSSAGLVVDLHALYPPSCPSPPDGGWSARPTPSPSALRSVPRGDAGARGCAAGRPHTSSSPARASSRCRSPPCSAPPGAAHVDPDVSGVTRSATPAPAGLLPGDAHRPRGSGRAEAVRRAAPDAHLTPPATGRRPPSRCSRVLRPGQRSRPCPTPTAGLAHLAVTIRDGVVVVGPLVRPGPIRLPELPGSASPRPRSGLAHGLRAAAHRPGTPPSRSPRPRCWSARPTPPPEVLAISTG